MTTATTTTSPAIIFSHSGLPYLSRQDRSRYPRGAITFQTGGVVITAGGVSDQRWTIACPLPANFAYVLAEAHVRIEGLDVDMANWETSCSATATSATEQIPFDGINTAGDSMLASTTSRRIFTFPDLPKAILVNGVSVDFALGNKTIGDGAMTGILYARLYTYDIEQAHHVLVNTADLVR